MLKYATIFLFLLSAGTLFALDNDYPGVITDDVSILPPLEIGYVPELTHMAAFGVSYFVLDDYPIIYYQGLWWRQLNYNWYVTDDYAKTWVLAMDESVPDILFNLGPRFCDQHEYYPKKAISDVK
jgi:hypothetical protein